METMSGYLTPNQILCTTNFWHALEWPPCTPVYTLCQDFSVSKNNRCDVVLADTVTRLLNSCQEQCILIRSFHNDCFMMLFYYWTPQLLCLLTHANTILTDNQAVADERYIVNIRLTDMIIATDEVVWLRFHQFYIHMPCAGELLNGKWGSFID